MLKFDLYYNQLPLEGIQEDRVRLAPTPGLPRGKELEPGIRNILIPVEVPHVLMNPLLVLDPLSSPARVATLTERGRNGKVCSENAPGWPEAGGGEKGRGAHRGLAGEANTASRSMPVPAPPLAGGRRAQLAFPIIARASAMSPAER